jgi:hypothetical protein
MLLEKINSLRKRLRLPQRFERRGGKQLGKTREAKQRIGLAQRIAVFRPGESARMHERSAAAERKCCRADSIRLDQSLHQRFDGRVLRALGAGRRPMARRGLVACSEHRGIEILRLVIGAARRAHADRHPALRQIGVEFLLVRIAIDVVTRDPGSEPVVAENGVIARPVGDGYALPGGP